MNNFCFFIIKLVALLLFVFFLTNNNVFAQIRPDQIDGLKMWLRADSNIIVSGDTVMEWKDCSENNNNATQNEVIRRPQIINNVSKINKFPVIRFDGVNDYLLFSDITDIRTCFFVVKHKTGNGFYPPILGHLSVCDFAGGNEENLFSSFTSVFIKEGSVYVNGIQMSPLDVKKPIQFSLISIVTSGNVKAENIGSDRQFTYQYFPGDYAEIIIYNKVLNNEQRVNIENYLTNKYSPKLDLGEDVNISYGLCDTIINTQNNSYTSYLWNTGETSPSIQVRKPGTYWLEVEDVFGRKSRDTISVQYPYTPQGNKFFCLSDTVSVNTNLSHAYSFLWSNGSTDSLIKIWEPGEYWVKITDTTANYCFLTDTFTVATDSFAVKANLGADKKMCAGNDISLVFGADQNISYLWNTGSTAQNLTIHTSGEYSITATNSNACVAKDTINISIISTKPKVTFAHSTACFGEATNLVDMSYAFEPDKISSWVWISDFDTISKTQNANTTFSQSGIYNVKLSIKTDSACTADTTIAVRVRALPNVSFSPNHACSGQEVYMKDHTSIGDGDLFTWSWNFGDGHLSNLQNPKYVFADSGSYIISLKVHDIFGCKDSTSKPIIVRLSPKVDFDFMEGCARQPVSFFETTHIPHWDMIISRKWNFDNNYYSNVKNPMHTFAEAGSYTISLYNKTISGCADSVSKVVVVHAFPNAGFVESNLCVGSNAIFIDISTISDGHINDWQWFLDDKLFSNSKNPYINFADSGIYNVTLKAQSDFGCITSISKGIEVHSAPQSDFDIKPEYGTPPLNVQFFNQSKQAISYLWNFGDAGTATHTNPEHTFTEEKIYDVFLVSTNKYNCKDTAFGMVYVIPSTLDLVLTNLNVSDSSNYINISANFFNNGTRNVRYIALDATINNSVPIREEWQGLLEPGKSGYYKFNSSFLKRDQNLLPTICLLISALDVENQKDVELENNTACFSQSNKFSVSSIFPNPANEFLYAEIIVPEADDISVSVISRDGKVIFDESLSVNSGVCRFRLDVSNFANGAYSLRIIYKDKKESIVFLKV